MTTVSLAFALELFTSGSLMSACRVSMHPHQTRGGISFPTLQDQQEQLLSPPTLQLYGQMAATSCRYSMSVHTLSPALMQTVQHWQIDFSTGAYKSTSDLSLRNISSTRRHQLLGCVHGPSQERCWHHPLNLICALWWVTSTKITGNAVSTINKGPRSCLS